MTPAARIQSAVELLELVRINERKPADVTVRDFFKTHRFIGGGDRRAIGDLVFAVSRHYHGLSASIGGDSARALTFLYLKEHGGLTLADIKALCAGGYSPEPLTASEMARLKNHAPYDRFLLPDWARGRVPKDLLPYLFAQAPVDIRVNTLKNGRDFVLACLKRENYDCAATPFSPLGIRFVKRVPLNSHKFWENGTLEIQEEASQIAALLCDAKPGMSVLDYCAGTGGKSLALAASMKNKGNLVLADIADFRLKRAKERLRRAGAHNCQIKIVDKSRHNFKKCLDRFDRVLVDVPCSGSGTWRRNPDIKTRFTETDLGELVVVQREILAKAHAYVRPGGRLIYATCSFFEEENERQIDEFLKTHENFAVVPIKKVWEETIGGACPFATDHARFLTNEHGTDCFFVCVMEKS